MREQRHCDTRIGSPPWQRSCERDPGIREPERFSPSYLSPTPLRPQHDCSKRLVRRREDPFCGGDVTVRSLSASVPGNPEREKYLNNQCFSGLNRFTDRIGPETDQFSVMGSVHRGEYSDETERQWQKISGFSESAMGMGEKSSFVKFQWDNLLVDNKPINANADRKNFGGLCDSGVVPMYLSMENDGGGSSRSCFSQRLEPTESGIDFGLINGGYASSSTFGNFGMIGKRTSIVDSIVDKIEGGDSNVYSDIDNDSAFRNNVMSDGRILLEKDTSFVEDEKDVDCRSLKLTPEILQFVEDLGFRRHGRGSSSDEDGVERIPMSYKELDSPGSSCQRLVTLEEALEMRLERNRRLDMETSYDDQKIILSCDWNASDETLDSTCGWEGNWTYEDIEQLAMSENLDRGKYQGGIIENVIDESAVHGYSGISTHGISLSSTDALLSKPRCSSKPVKPFKRNVRQRLGQALSIKDRLGPALSIEHRLRLAPQVGKRLGTDLKVHKKLPGIKMLKENIPEDLEQKINVRVMKCLDVKTQNYAKTEPHEDSEKFKHLVQSAFLKFFKVLNENSANRRKYLEEGRAGSLKCIVCGSNSKEFVDTLGLTQHAFFSWKVGSRSEHLGLYKAICVLMGWNSTIIPNGRWVWQILPSAEASPLREDLIIWPPVVFIHNSSIANDNKDKRIIVSIDGLKHILGGMGCDLRIANLCNGKAANQSTTVVKFDGRFSGLQEAEKLHKLFDDRKQGRTEFQQISSIGCKINYQEPQNVLVDEVESFLYGYLGIASDFDMLDSETKKRCVVRSKKEMEATAVASINAK